MTQADIDAIRVHFNQTGSLTKQQSADLLDGIDKMYKETIFSRKDILSTVTKLLNAGITHETILTWLMTCSQDQWLAISVMQPCELTQRLNKLANIAESEAQHDRTRTEKD